MLQRLGYSKALHELSHRVEIARGIFSGRGCGRGGESGGGVYRGYMRDILGIFIGII